LRSASGRPQRWRFYQARRRVSMVILTPRAADAMLFARCRPNRIGVDHDIF
jgi:hypothetical protein